MSFDAHGFLPAGAPWDEDVAAALAAAEGLTQLTEDHWKVLRFIRKHHEETGTAPTARKLCQETGFKLNDIYGLFPSGPVDGACRIAGLPEPDRCG